MFHSQSTSIRLPLPESKLTKRSIPNCPTSFPCIPSTMTLELKAQPLTHEAWAPYGDLITGTDNLSSVPQRVVVNKITHNPILGHKFNRVAPITSLYPSDANAQTTISVIRVGPPAGLTNHDGHSGRFQVRMLEKHIASSQAFVPMQRQPIAFENWTGEPSLPKTDGGGMIVVGCLPKDGESARR